MTVESPKALVMTSDMKRTITQKERPIVLPLKQDLGIEVHLAGESILPTPMGSWRVKLPCLTNVSVK
jgi:hypothetical protein